LIACPTNRVDYKNHGIKFFEQPKALERAKRIELFEQPKAFELFGTREAHLLLYYLCALQF